MLRSLTMMKALLLMTAFLAFLPGAVAQEAECIEGDVTLTVQEDGILVSWPQQDSVIVYDVFRKEAGADTFEHVGQTPNFESEFFDATAEPGTTYTYQVVVKFDTTGPGSAQTAFCDEPTATAIPVFPTLAAGVAGTGLGLAAYGTMGRRR